MNKDKIIKVIALIAMIMFFVPTFAVSCASETVNVSACQAMTGIVEETTVNDPTYAVILLLIIPIIMFAAQVFSSGPDSTEQKVAGVMAVADIIGWMLLKSGIDKYCEENMCSSKTNMWFAINIILLGIAAVLSFMQDLKVETPQYKPENIPSFTPQESEAKFCTNCGKQLESGTKYCPKCGKEVNV